MDKKWKYRGCTIERIHPSGYYATVVERCDRFGGLSYERLMADTLAGVKQLIKNYLNRLGWKNNCAL